MRPISNIHPDEPDNSRSDEYVVASQNTHRKLSEIAREVVLTGQLNWGAGSLLDGPDRRSAAD